MTPEVTETVETAETAAPKQEQVILPFEYGEDEHYYVEDLGKIRPKPIYAFIKRLFDIVCALLGIVITLIPMIIIAICIKCTSKGKVFFTQERLGKNGKKFHLIKFRTMIDGAEKGGAQWSQGDNDTRIYPFGAKLRKTRLDELPQLFLILSGHLSLVGPRPERECFYDAFEKHVHGFSERLKVKQGLTGLAQVSGGYDLRPEEKVLYDVEYIKKRSLWMDIKILFKTGLVVFNHKGAK